MVLLFSCILNKLKSHDGFTSGTLSLIGHSAGGWLARVYMEEFGLSHISLLLTLGTPHLPPPNGLPEVIDQTRGLLCYVEQHCKKAVYTPDLKYGAQFFSDSNVDVDSVVGIDDDQPISDVAVLKNKTDSTSVSSTFRARFVGQGYKQVSALNQVCGQTDVWGDGVVP
ncbi:hypothetical protein CRYUN_Cryun16bG0044800 [Craigia yunnanensis]